MGMARAQPACDAGANVDEVALRALSGEMISSASPLPRRVHVAQLEPEEPSHRRLMANGTVANAEHVGLTWCRATGDRAGLNDLPVGHLNSIHRGRLSCRIIDIHSSVTSPYSTYRRPTTRIPP